MSPAPRALQRRLARTGELAGEVQAVGGGLGGHVQHARHLLGQELGVVGRRGALQARERAELARLEPAPLALPDGQHLELLGAGQRPGLERSSSATACAGARRCAGRRAPRRACRRRPRGGWSPAWAPAKLPPAARTAAARRDAHHRTCSSSLRRACDTPGAAQRIWDNEISVGRRRPVRCSIGAGATGARETPEPKSHDVPFKGWSSETRKGATDAHVLRLRRHPGGGVLTSGAHAAPGAVLMDADRRRPGADANRARDRRAQPAAPRTWRWSASTRAACRSPGASREARQRSRATPSRSARSTSRSTATTHRQRRARSHVRDTEIPSRSTARWSCWSTTCCTPAARSARRSTR